RRQEKRPAVSGIPALIAQVDPALHLKAERHFPRWQCEIASQGLVLRALADRDAQLAGWQADFTTAVDVGMAAIGEVGAAVHRFIRVRPKIALPAEGSQMLPIRSREADPHGCRLSRRSIVHAHVYGVILRAH